MSMLDEYIERITTSKKIHIALFLGLLFLMTLIMMWIHYPIISGHDIYFHFERFKSLITALEEGNYISYIDYKAFDGYGYLTRVFYPDLMLIPFAYLAIITGSKLLAYQAMLVVITILCGVFSYIMMHRITGNTFTATLFGLLVPFCYYRLVDIYPRGALGESMAFTFAPLIFWGIFEIIRGDYKKWYILTIGFTLLIYTHTISSIMIFIAILIFVLFSIQTFKKEPKRLKYLLIASFATVLFVGFYIFPLLEQLLNNAFYFQAGTKGLIVSEQGETPKSVLSGLLAGYYTSGRVGTGIVLSLIVFLRIFIRKKTDLLRLADFLVIIAFAFIFIVSDLYPWQTSPFSILKIVQFSWRFYYLISFFFAFSGAIYVSILFQKPRMKLVGILLILSINTALMITNEKSIWFLNDYNPENKPMYENAYYQAGMDYIPEKVPSPAPDFFHSRGKDSIRILDATAFVKNYKRDKGCISFDVESSTPVSLELPLIYYKGYKATENNAKLEINESENGLVELQISNPGIIRIEYKGTIVQRLSFYICLFSLLFLLIYIFKIKDKNTTKS